ncbi:MAG: LysM peptidoglycan-binding domain-containing protein [Elusimicrobia bacterium]|nr:LysM peptidoglycan-binding domain-containing protein [Elusimicrobiota bacterium]
MKRTALFFLIFAAPAALFSQQTKLTEVKLDEPEKAATDTVKAAADDKVTVIEPVVQPAKTKAKPAAKAPASATTKAGDAKSQAAADYAAKYLHVSPDSPVVGRKESAAPQSKAASPQSKAAADYAAKYLHVSPDSPVVGSKESSVTQPKAAAPKSKAAADYAAKYLRVKPGAKVVGAAGPVPGKTAAPRVMPAVAAPQAEGGFRVLKRHVIVPGDTLWDLAAKYYNNPFMWGRIYNANFSTVSNPDRIYPKNELVIPDISELLIPYRTPEVASADLTPEEGAQEPAPAPSPSVSAVRAPAMPSADEDIPDLDSNYLSEEMPEDQKEWSDGVKVVPDSWTEDGVVTAKLKNDDDFLEDGISSSGEVLEISMDSSGLVRPGDYLNVYLRGADAFDKEGNRIGRELQYAGTAEVFSVDDTDVKARILDATTAIYKDYVVKKK